jgi:hypothetical protein
MNSRHLVTHFTFSSLPPPTTAAARAKMELPLEAAVKLWLKDVESASQRTTPALKTTEEHSTTPRTSAAFIAEYEELSPTLTFFTDQTIFDSPIKNNHPGDYGPDDDIVSVATSHSLPAYKPRVAIEEAVEKGFSDLETVNLSTACHVSSFEPATDLEDREDTPPILVDEPFTEVRKEPYDSKGKPPAISIVSCLQCTLKNLPCTRTFPSCSRCIRHGHGHLCLAQRSKFLSEMFLDDGTSATQPVLLRLKDAVDPFWPEKLLLREEASHTSELPVV